ncbi:DUF2905 domain-containing protein [Lacihabitans lacunae]|jgi:hypothetical protein|uniref:DUF2905 domain-containing protein n=1 Tax=Lacihabitans lacunae TaxID=1028214 RepID=A0ABV7YV53_9BACT
MNPQIGKYLIGFGLLILIVGLIIFFFGEKLSWMGKLPGDIIINKPNLKIYFPVATMILLSLGINLIIWLIRKFF